MDSLEKYARIFDKKYINYSDVRHQKISTLIKVYDTPDVAARVQSGEFAKLIELIAPVIAIKNYKSQIPFPEDLVSVVLCIIEIRSAPPSSSDVLSRHKAPFDKLLSLQGFQLPTVSAVLHFSHPEYFPIVDVNVEAACSHLKKIYPDDFTMLDEPSLPAVTTSADNKTEKYGVFIKFINKVRELQGGHGGQADFRYIDKALMVLGAERLREKRRSRPR
jgi:hypothetical protein